jgi:hypothetical protein
MKVMDAKSETSDISRLTVLNAHQKKHERDLSPCFINLPNYLKKLYAGASESVSLLGFGR